MSRPPRRSSPVFAALALPATAAETKPLILLVLYADDWRRDTRGVSG